MSHPRGPTRKGGSRRQKRNHAFGKDQKKEVDRHSRTGKFHGIKKKRGFRMKEERANPSL